MKIAAILILYNPYEQVEFIKNNLNIYSEQFDKIYLVDNSPEPSNLFENISGKIVYFHNRNLGGIAGAQNVGCSKAMEDGFEWAMTLDQDSTFTPEKLKTYLTLCTQHISDKNASFTLRFVRKTHYNTTLFDLIRFHILSPIKRKILHQNNLPKAGTPPKPEDKTIKEEITISPKAIASCNVINLKVWEEIGKFDEKLFIDEVDNDYCFRLTRKGYNILQFNTIYAYHKVGDDTFSLFRKNYPSHNAFRLFYIFRNHFIIIKRYPEHSNEYKQELRKILIDNLLITIHPLRNFIVLIKAFRDSKTID